MSPKRPGSQSSQPARSKPYIRNATHSLPMTSPIVNCEPQEIAQNQTLGEGQTRAGFPTYGQYKQIEANYIGSLTPRRQGKALISQSMFDRIWDVLHDPESQKDTAQFRFWARKMFVLSKSQPELVKPRKPSSGNPPEVILHDGLLVAVQEQIYDILCYCHGSTGHGGRDKTCGLIRKYYTWVPKDLVSNFIKSCPTCIRKKCGQLDPVTSAAASAATSQANPDSDGSSDSSDSSILPALRDFLDSVSAQDQSELVKSNSSWALSSSSPESLLYPDLISAGNRFEEQYKAQALKNFPPKLAGCAPGTNLSRELHSYPMSREVSLYKGLPGGWQYRYQDYASAHAAFMEMKNNPDPEAFDPRLGNKRARVPSIAPLWGPDDPRNTPIDYSWVDPLEDTLPPLASHLSGNESQQGQSGLPPSLQKLLVSSSSSTSHNNHVPQIDPVLLALSASPSKVANSSVANNLDPPMTSSIKRAAAPPSLNLDTSQLSFQDMLAYRDNLESGNITPNSPGTTAWLVGNPSPTSSTGSPLSMTMETGVETSVTPDSSAPVTPADECGGQADDQLGKELAVEACGLTLSASLQAVCGM